MNSNGDWLPRNHEGLCNQANDTVDYLTADVLNRIGITGSSLNWYNTDFIPKHDALNLAFDNWKNPAERTKVITAAFITAENEFKPLYRKLYIGFLKGNPLVTDEDLVAMGLPKHSTGAKTPPTPPTDVVEATTDTSKPGIVGINFRTKNAKGTAKPKHVRGAEIVSAVLDTPPTDWAQLTHSSFDTKTPAQLVFTGEQRGKTLYFALRWENNVGEKGPWSEIYSAIIP
ncbi:MAG: hypothetical protein LBF59_00820 [Prevotellaceae bacterium]|jgi:hypothetical protein|nr:hypothetical protein [Prevotellaceae bacterium]